MLIDCILVEVREKGSSPASVAWIVCYICRPTADSWLSKSITRNPFSCITKYSIYFSFDVPKMPSDFCLYILDDFRHFSNFTQCSDSTALLNIQTQHFLNTRKENIYPQKYFPTFSHSVKTMMITVEQLEIPHPSNIKFYKFYVIFS